MITKYSLYNESIRDKMTPKSKEDIKKSIRGLEPIGIVKQLIHYPYLINGIFTDAEIRDVLSKTDPDVTLRLVEQNVKLLKILLDVRDIGEFNNRYIYQLLYDSMKRPGYKDVVRHLIDNMDDINRDYSAYLRFAIDQDVSDEIVKYLLKKGADPSLAISMWRNRGLNREEHIRKLRRLESEVLHGK